MGLRFHKSFSLLPGVRVNVSKTGLSLSIGGAPMTINFRRGRSRVTTSLPGTGLSYSKESRHDPLAGSSILQKAQAWLSRLFSA